MVMIHYSLGHDDDERGEETPEMCFCQKYCYTRSRLKKKLIFDWFWLISTLCFVQQLLDLRALPCVYDWCVKTATRRIDDAPCSQELFSDPMRECLK